MSQISPESAGGRVTESIEVVVIKEVGGVVEEPAASVGYGAVGGGTSFGAGGSIEAGTG